MDEPRPHPGLCADCVNARTVPGARTLFWRCDLADRDPRFARYPRLPVTRCSGHRPAGAPRADPGGTRG